jgi:hypothetical protein
MTLLGPSRAEGAAPNRRHRRLLVFPAWSCATCRSLYPGGSAGCTYRLLPPHGSTSPLVRRVVFRIDFFEASSGLHLRYGLLLRGITNVILSIEGFDKFVSSLAASIATGQSDHSQAGLAPAEPTKFHDARTRLVTFRTGLSNNLRQRRNALLLRQLELGTRRLAAAPKIREQHS